MLEITKLLLTNTSKFTKNANTPKNIVIHYTAGDKGTAQGTRNYFENSTVISSAHYNVDENFIVQCVEHTDAAYHAGNWAMNTSSIGIEMCCYCPSGESTADAYSNWYFAEETVKNTVDLVRYLMEMYNIPITNVIRHYDVTGKICPSPYCRNDSAKSDWLVFLDRVQDVNPTEEEQEDEVMKYQTIEELPSYYKGAIEELVSLGCIAGTGSGLDISEDMARLLTITKSYIDKKG